MTQLLPVTPSFEGYFLRRLAEELALARASTNRIERKAHLRACRLYRNMLDCRRRTIG